MCIGQLIFRTMLSEQLLRSFSGIEVEAIITAGARAGAAMVPGAQKVLVKKAYLYAVSRVFVTSIVTGGLAFLCALGIKWGNLRKAAKPDTEVGDQGQNNSQESV